MQLQKATPLHRCVFEYVYFARPDSLVEGTNVYHARQRIGAELAREQPAPADIVVPVPDSGVPAALGYAQQAGLPFELGIIRNHYVGRTFIEPAAQIRHLGVKLKHNANRATLAGKRVVLVDDSIVRGTTLKFLTKMLRDAGADKVHIRISSPPVMNPCYYGMDFPSKEELIAGTMTQEETRKLLGADTLEYLSIKGLLSVVPRGGGSYCAACFDGKYPEEIPAGSTKFRCE